MLVFASLILAVSVNGFPFWLKHVGWLDSAPCQLCEQKIEHYRARITAEQREYQRERLGYAEFYWYAFARFRPSGAERYAKLAKDASVLMLLAVCVLLGGGRETWRTDKDWLLGGFLAVVALALLSAGVHYQWPVVAAGARGFSFLLVTLLAYRFSDDSQLALLARMLAWLLVVQLPLALLELSAPEQLFSGEVLGVLAQGRAVGTFVHPTGLGLFAVLTLVLYACFVDPASRHTMLLAIAAAVLVVLSGSGTAMILFIAASGWLLSRGFRSVAARWMLIALMSSAVVAALPWITGRDEIFASATGRLWALGAFFASGMDLWDFMLGHGLGVGTNTLITLSREGLVQLPQGQFPRVLLESIDSTPLALLAQVGFAGCVLFYCLLFRSVRLDVKARPLLLIMLVASTMINLTEFFPINVILGLLLARGVRGRVTEGGIVGRTPGEPRAAAEACL